MVHELHVIDKLGASGLPADSGFIHLVIRDKGALHLCCTHSVSTHIDDIVHPPCAHTCFLRRLYMV